MLGCVFNCIFLPRNFIHTCSSVITQNTIQQILSRIDILDIVGGFVKLKRRGANYLGLCPFHNEKSPSFTVSPSKEIYKCFGCGKSGNSISFLMEHEKLSYVEALRWLAAKYNIEIEETAVAPEVKQQMQTAESLHIINTFAQKFYANALFETPAGKDIGLTYLEQRGFEHGVLKKFEIGYAPDSRDAFTKEALAAQFNPELLQRSGLVTERNGQLQDNYRDRIIFPVHNNTGKIVGFGARQIRKNDKSPKYINTPENEVYVKSKLLYGTYFARQAIDKADECLLVEGYTDVVSLHQAGVENVVASGGTSLTLDQLRLVKKYTKNLTIIYDGDAAGVKAALRGLDLALEEGLNVKLVLIPDGEDPDSYVRKVGHELFKKFVAEHKKDFVLFQLDVLLKDAGTDAAKKSELVNIIAETISKIDRTEDFSRQQEYIRQSAQILKIDEAGFTTLVNKAIRNRISLVENKLPFEEAKVHEENAQKAKASNYSDETFNLLFKDELQEREIVKVLLEHGTKEWDETQTIAAYILAELPEDDLIDNKTLMQIINVYKQQQEEHTVPDKSIFIYNPDPDISALTVSLLYFPYEQSPRWRSEMSQASGFQKKLFEQDAKSFYATISPDNEEGLAQYLKVGSDTTTDHVASAINYLKLRKIKRLLLQNQADLENAEPSKVMPLMLTHQHLKSMEMDLTKKLGTVVF